MLGRESLGSREWVQVVAWDNACMGQVRAMGQSLVMAYQEGWSRLGWLVHELD